MITIHELPALRLLCGVIAGITAAPYITSLTGEWIFLLICPVIVLFLLFYNRRVDFNRRYLPGIIQLVLTFFLAVILVNFTDERRSGSHIVNLDISPDTTVTLIGKCVDPPRHTGSWQIVFRSLHQITDGGRLRRATGKFIVFCKDLDAVPRPGEIYRIAVRLTVPGSAAVPGSFDYRSYLESQRIYKTGFVSAADLNKISETSVWNMRNWSTRARDWLVARSTELLGEGEYADVAAGLLFGYRDRIDAQTEEMFVNTGSVHLLAVSGMHVVLIYNNLLFFLRLLRFSKKRGERRLSVLAIAGIWVFTFIAGLAASIVRAAVMLSLVVAGSLIRRSGHTVNIVSGGAVVMLLWEPLMLYDVGFQLSFAAVMGIILLQQPIRNMFPASVLRFRDMTDLLSVTVAAQIGTLPLILYYFHQFPVYFLVSGIVAVFISDWVIKIGFVLLFVSVVWMPAAVYFSLLWKISVVALLKSIHLIDCLPFGLVSGIYFSLPMAVILAVLIILTCIHFHVRMRYYGHLSIGLLLILFTLDGISLIRAKSTSEVRTYVVQNKSVLVEYKGFTSFVYADNRLDSAKVSELLAGERANRRIRASLYYGKRPEELEAICRVRTSKVDNGNKLSSN